MTGRRRRWLRRLLEVAAVVLVFLLVQAWLTREAPRGPAPPVSGTLLDGSQVSLDDLKGRPALLHFWATWCPICGLQQGAINAIAKDHAVLTIAMDEASADEIRGYLQDAGVNYPVLRDPAGDIARHYAIRGVPTSFILDRESNIRFVETGYTTGIGLRLRLWLTGRKPVP
jgi:thiol-disulfide isomerase/thioredoxin